MSRYDQPDPSLDRDYCDGLEATYTYQYTADTCPGRPCSTDCDHRGVPPVADDARPLCLWCSEPLPDTSTDYCSALCACYAEKDGIDR